MSVCPDQARLGLTIARRLTELMGGDCGVTSRVGVGSIFWFSLTLGRARNDGTATAPVRAEATVSLASARTPGLRRLARVLVVEDNAVNRLVARGHLEAAGCVCDTADNGVQAVAMLRNGHPYDLVLMDCQMPEMDGMEATRRVRASEEASGSRTPIVALTANAMVGDRETCIAAGMDDFLSKPFLREDLTRVLARWCSDAPSAMPLRAQSALPG